MQKGLKRDHGKSCRRLRTEEEDDDDDNDDNNDDIGDNSNVGDAAGSQRADFTCGRLRVRALVLCPFSGLRPPCRSSVPGVAGLALFGERRATSGE